ncbi:ParB N-terminal domain-containing protein [Saxibacter everestensis]|uniref:ParB N-terminal domain-containing protein n=1 Tax=Saxibacter everestensis TaxID=2909229 RepID=A0ABY8QUI2_9MICO|nr:ParB N-terminal domain-containing protein [Brevibacteriaceae bacterium ZFBP1038]
MTTLKITDIRIEDRHRTDLGDINALADSIKIVGLLHPPVVNAGFRLIAGERRLAAVRSLGWAEVPVTVVDLSTAGEVLRGEADENTCRKAFTPSEAETIASAIEAALKPAAKERQSPGRPAKNGGNLPPLKQPKTRDVAAMGTGFSEKTIRSVREIKAKASDPSTPAPVRKQAEAALAEMDRTGNVNGPHKEFKRAETEAERVIAAVAEFPELQYYVGDGRIKDLLRLATSLRTFQEPELSMRRENLRKTIAAEQRKAYEPEPDTGPDYFKLADAIFQAANTAARLIGKSGGPTTISEAIPITDALLVEQWREQFERLASQSQALADTCKANKLRIVR